MKYLKLAILSLCVAALAFSAEAAKPLPAPKIADPRSVTVGERAVVPIYVCPLQETMLVLPVEEKVMSAYVADTANWKLESGKDAASRYVSIKVKEPLSSETTVNLVSDRDTIYTFRLVLSADKCDSRVSIDADSGLEKKIQTAKPWVSPAEADKLKAEVEAAKKASEEASKKATASADAFRAEYPTQLKFDYDWDHKMGEKFGVAAIFSDSKFTYISGKFDEPPTFYEVKDKKPSLISFDFRNGVYSTARVVRDGYLAIGGNGNGKRQARLEFHRVEAN